MIYINKMDIMGANFYNVVDMVHERLRCNAVPIQLPIGAEADFRGIIDLIDMKADVYYDDLGKDMRVEEIPEDMRDEAEEYRTQLIEAVADFDDEDDLVTEELAEIYRQQGLNDEACAIYRKLSLRNPEKSVYFAELIDEIASEGKNR